MCYFLKIQSGGGWRIFFLRFSVTGRLAHAAHLPPISLPPSTVPSRKPFAAPPLPSSLACRVRLPSTAGLAPLPRPPTRRGPRLASAASSGPRRRQGRTRMPSQVPWSRRLVNQGMFPAILLLPKDRFGYACLVFGPLGVQANLGSLSPYPRTPQGS
jgi:hypothetical protein